MENNELNSLSMYLKEINNIPTLTHEQQYELAVKAKSGDSLARERLLNSNLRFVVSVAKQFQGRGLALEDLISEGNLGLLTALDKYEPDRGYHFITYAIWWIRQAIIKAINEKGRMIRLPANKTADINQILNARKKLEDMTDETVSTEDIARECGFTEKDVRELLKLTAEVSSLDKPVAESEGSCLGDFIESDTAKPEDILLENSVRESVEEILSSLPERDANILRLRYGFDGREEMGLKDIGEVYGLTKERIRQIQSKTLSKLGSDEKLSHLKVYVA